MAMYLQESSLVWGLLGEVGWDGKDVVEEDFGSNFYYSD